MLATGAEALAFGLELDAGRVGVPVRGLLQAEGHELPLALRRSRAFRLRFAPERG